MNNDSMINCDGERNAAYDARINNGEAWCDDCGWAWVDDVIQCEDGQMLCTRCAMEQGIRACTICGAFDHWCDGQELTDDGMDWACHFCTVERADEVEAHNKIGWSSLPLDEI